jgi:cholera toxin transcriptional activator
MLCVLMAALEPISTGRIVYKFGPYDVDVGRGELLKFNRWLRIQRKPWLLLLKLLERRGEVVSRDELQRCLWGSGVFVDVDNGLNVAVKKLRDAIREHR